MSIEKDFTWVKKCVESSLTEMHLQVGERLVRAFHRKWKNDSEIEFYLPILQEAQKEKKTQFEE